MEIRLPITQKPVIIAGPCVIESQECLNEVAEELVRLNKKSLCTLLSSWCPGCTWEKMTIHRVLIGNSHHGLQVCRVYVCVYSLSYI